LMACAAYPPNLADENARLIVFRMISRVVHHTKGLPSLRSHSKYIAQYLCRASSSAAASVPLIDRQVVSRAREPLPVEPSSVVTADLKRMPDEQALVDLFGRKHTYLRVSLTEKCNFRCTYCMPEEGVTLTKKDELPTLEERKRLVNIFVRLGVRKLRFTGGEPTVSKQLLPLLEHAGALFSPDADADADADINAAGAGSGAQRQLAIESAGITTNGYALKQQIPALVAAGLTSVNISLDSLQQEKFASLTRRKGTAMLRVLSAVYAAVDAGLKTKINCVLMAGTNDDELGDFVKLTRDTDIDVRFIEYMPFDGNKWKSKSLLGYRDAIARLEHEHGIILEPATRAAKIDIADGGADLSELADPNDTTKWFRAPGHVGRVGFITTMTQNFCGSCNRLRLTADGKLKVCLFGQDELSLLDCMREGMSDEEVIMQMAGAVRRKEARLGGETTAEDLVGAKNRSMIMIGG